MERARKDCLTMALLGAFIFVFFGVALGAVNPAAFSDFKTLYYPARTMVEDRNPYAPTEVMSAYRAEAASNAGDTAIERQISTQNPYPPTALLVMAPIALLPWGAAHILWMWLTIGGFLLASYLILNLAAGYDPKIAGFLIFLLLGNSELLIITGNVSGMAISLCAISVWCFLRERLAWAGVVCLAVSLALKPHEAGLVWLYFLLAGGVLRKRALQTLLVSIAIGLFALVWIGHLAPHWLQEMNANIAEYARPGGINDPGPSPTGSQGADRLIDLQTIFSVFRDDSRFYNLATWLVCGPLLLVWGGITLRTTPTPKRMWLALASVAALTMLPIYHRQLDAKLLLLAIPGCALLWAEGGRIGRWALGVSVAALLATADLAWLIAFAAVRDPQGPVQWFARRVLLAGQSFPAPLCLLAMGVFYLWAYAREAKEPVLRGGLK